MSEPLSLECEPVNRGRTGFYYGWVNLGIAAMAMIATLPGRTQGIGLITEPLLRDLGASHVEFALQNLWATLIGSTFCLGCGPLIDRFGARSVLALVLALLGGTVLAMSRITGMGGLLVTLTLTRGFGQSALSVVSLTIVGKWFVRRLPTAMGVYSVLIGIGFVAAFPGVGYAVMHAGWRGVWWWMGWILLAGLASLGWLLVRSTPEEMGIAVDGRLAAVDAPAPAHPGLTVRQAIGTMAFWSFSLSATAFGLVSSGLMLFNEAVLRERGMPSHTVLMVLAVITFVSLGANLLGGWLAGRWPVGRLMGGAMFLLAAALLLLPLAHGPLSVYGYAVAMGMAAGIVTVVFFVCWGKVFGRRHLGAIQGAAQLLTILGSAVGPLLLAESTRITGSSTAFLFLLAPLVLLLGVFCLISPLPELEQAE